MDDKLDKHILKNGMVLLGEPMESVASVAFGFILPCGSATIAVGLCGAGNVIADWIFRGAAGKNTRQISDEIDGLGLHRAASLGSSHLSLGAVLEASSLDNALPIYADIIQKPNLEDDQFELAKQLAADSVLALEDAPRQNVMLKLRESFYPDPIGRSTAGKIEDLEKLTAKKTRQIINNNFNLSDTIFSIAGKYDFDAVIKQMEYLFNTDKRPAAEHAKLQQKQNEYTHFPNEGAQVHIGMMTKTVKSDSPDFYNAQVAVSILSGGMSARLFTEVREKRGLCYAIGARYHSLKDAAGIMCYAGTTPDKAQETLDVIIAEFDRLKNGITEEELQRAKVGLKSSLIMSSESSASRASNIAGDFYILNRVRSLDEIKQEIEKISVDSVLKFLNENIFADYTAVTIGPKQVKIN